MDEYLRHIWEHLSDIELRKILERGSIPMGVPTVVRRRAEAMIDAIHAENAHRYATLAVDSIGFGRAIHRARVKVYLPERKTA